MNNLKGFSLIEAIVVAVIIAILAATGIPLYNGYLNSSRMNNARSNLELVGAAVMQTHNRGIDISASDWAAIGITDPSDNNWTYTFNALAPNGTIANVSITATGRGSCNGKSGNYLPNAAAGSRFTGDLTCFN